MCRIQQYTVILSSNAYFLAGLTLNFTFIIPLYQEDTAFLILHPLNHIKKQGSVVFTCFRTVSIFHKAFSNPELQPVLRPLSFMRK